MSSSTLTLAGDSRQLERDLKKARDEIEKLKQGMREAGAESTRSNRDSRRHVEDHSKALRDQFTAIGSVAAGYLSTGAAIRAATFAIAEMNREAAKAQGAVQGGAPGIGALAQLAGGDPKELQRLEELALSIRQQGGASSLAEALGIVFELKSAGLDKETSFISKLKDIDRPSELIASAAKLRAALGAGEAGTLEQIVSKALAASGPVASAGASDILRAVLPAAAGAKAFGVPDEELLAAVATAAQGTESPAVAGTQISSFFKAMQRQGLAEQLSGQGIQALVKNVQSRELDQKSLIKFLGDIEAVRGFSALQGGGFQESLAAIEEAQRTNKIQDVIESARSRPIFESERRRRAAEGGLEIGTLEEGLRKQRLDTLQAINREIATAGGTMTRVANFAEEKIAGLGTVDFQRQIAFEQFLTLSQIAHGRGFVAGPVDRQAMLGVVQRHQAAGTFSDSPQILEELKRLNAQMGALINQSTPAPAAKPQPFMAPADLERHGEN